MQFEQGNFYHIYNRGVNKQKIFFSKRNYEYFLRKIQVHIVPNCSLLSYCLMPNHFHLLIYANLNTGERVDNSSILPISVLSEGIRMVLSSYAKAINKQESRVGNLFQQKTKCKCLNPKDIQSGIITHSSLYEEDCFNYIHFNPVKAGLVERPEDWEYSSYREYALCSGEPYCNVELGIRLLGLNIDKH